LTARLGREKELAEKFNTKESLLEHPAIAQNMPGVKKQK